ncbi:MAG: short-chain dehydrogenase/reductase [Proteobacteria bacterium]|nr:short-chain dehydrogenase/reductase [Pseudomonadota bacterium]MDA1331203.1 short-chain dehydrogenase/reductase [Pseudomonadota bacterium]
MDLNLEGKRALVTGASKGIGLAVAKGLLFEGCDVHLVARSEDALKDVSAKLNEVAQGRISYSALDLSKSENILLLLTAAGPIDILVNNAGAIPGGDLQTIDEVRWRDAWDLKVFGYINLSRAVYQQMAEKNSGVIINVTGLAADRLDTNYIAGSSANASLNAFSRALGSNSFKDGIRCLAVSPGAVETDRMVTLMKAKAVLELGSEDRWRDLLKSLPYGRAATTNEVADVVLFLASARASYLSGIVVNVDGGHSSRGGVF